MSFLTKSLFFFFLLFSAMLISSCSDAAKGTVRNETQKEQSLPSALSERQNSDAPSVGWWVK